MSTNRHHDVRAFHRRFGHDVREVPAVPNEETMRFRLKLIAEEFLEALDACGIREGNIEAILRETIANAPIDVDLPALIDALGDLDYVVEGTRAVCGVDGSPIHNAIHHANMTKDPVYVSIKDAYHKATAEDARAAVPTIGKPDPTAKPTKPAGWSPPDIAAELRRQGWRG